MRGLDTSPFPEDTAIPAREAAPLQVPAARKRGRIVQTGARGWGGRPGKRSLPRVRLADSRSLG